MLAVAHPAGEIAIANYAAIEATQGVVTGLGMAGLFVTSSQGALYASSYSLVTNRIL